MGENEMKFSSAILVTGSVGLLAIGAYIGHVGLCALSVHALLWHVCFSLKRDIARLESRLK